MSKEEVMEVVPVQVDRGDEPAISTFVNFIRLLHGL
jgi:hypothetical protein